MAIIDITQANYAKKVENANKPILLEFSAQWCGPCKRLAPILEELSIEYADKIIIGRVDIDKETVLTKRFHVSNVPMLFIMNKGTAVAFDIGYKTKDEILRLLTLKEKDIQKCEI